MYYSDGGLFTTFVFGITMFTCSMKYSIAVAIGQMQPYAWQNAVCQLPAEMKLKFLDAHNDARSKVQPTAANMEYMEWDDDLANLAQMWSNQCKWSHGFLKFGPWYPNPPSTKQLGQNLAREWGKWAKDKSDEGPQVSVKRWFEERHHYTFSKFESPMPLYLCTQPPCGHYTQLVWATSSKVGCALNWCDKYFGNMPHPWVPGETIVTCDYFKPGNKIGEEPYKRGTPCSLCPKGKDWCYKNLCRECKDSSAKCGFTLKRSQCNSDKNMMMNLCPKMCGFCGADQGTGGSTTGGTTTGGQGGSNIPMPGWCRDKYPNQQLCEVWAMKEECQKNPTWMQVNCQKSCNACCDDKYDHNKCQIWTVAGECDKNKAWMFMNCPRSCSHCFVTEIL